MNFTIPADFRRKEEGWCDIGKELHASPVIKHVEDSLKSFNFSIYKGKKIAVLTMRKVVVVLHFPVPRYVIPDCSRYL